MGLLDEAIKEHLELKRRHGADPTEVARLEHEALGPARREPVAEAPVAEEPIAAVEEEDVSAVEEPAGPPAPPLAIYDDDADEVIADERLEAPVRDVAREREPEPQEPEDVDQPTAQFSLEELEQASEEEDAVEEPESAEPAEPEAAEAEAAEAEPEPEPAEPHADVVPADEEPDSDDVLEETPEFLQETPEHDRLWFEQKPPRDFDF
jgi:hypothetical protein